MRLERQVKRHKETGRAYDHNTDGIHLPYVSSWFNPPHRPTWRGTTPLTPAQIAENETAKMQWEFNKARYDKAVVEHEKHWHYVPETYHRRATLQANRIYPISIKMEQFIKVI
jgi:hypothetical protein